MSDKRNIRVGITQGDINGVGYEIILKAFDNQEMFDICTPIVYGSPKAAAYHRKALEMETPYNAINNASEARKTLADPITTMTARGVSFTETSDAMGQGDKKRECSLPFICLDITKLTV